MNSEPAPKIQLTDAQRGAIEESVRALNGEVAILKDHGGPSALPLAVRRALRMEIERLEYLADELNAMLCN